MDHSQQLGHESIGKLLFKFSIPSIIGMVVTALYNMVDRIFVGQGVGSLAIAGIAVSFPMMNFMMACGMLIAFGAATLIAIRLGENRKEEAEAILGHTLVLLTLAYATLSVIGLIFIDPILRWFGASSEVLPYAREYLRIILFGGVFHGIGFGLIHLIRAEGNPPVSMGAMLLGALLNMVLDPIFIFVFRWGIAGAAWATILSQAASAVWTLSYYFSKHSALKLHLQYLKLKRALVINILMLGTPIALIEAITCIESIIYNKSLGAFSGDLAISAMGIISSISLLILMPIFGINLGAQPIIGYNYGAKHYNRVKQALNYSIAAATAVVLIGFLVCQFFAEGLIRLFNPNDRSLVHLGAYMVRVSMSALPLVGFLIAGGGYFQAVGKPKESMMLTLIRQVFLLIPLLLILPRFFGLNGILCSGPLSTVISFAVTLFWIAKEVRHLSGEAHRSPEMEELPSSEGEYAS